MSEPLALSLGQQFELERMTRMIDSTGDPQLGTPGQFGGMAKSAASSSIDSSSQTNVNGSMDVL
jgi:hypothetical protein